MWTTFSLNHHRRYSPISVVSTSVVDGMYYAGRLDNDPDPDIISRSHDLVSNLATRATILIRADNGGVALMCFIGAGFGEVSTCQSVENMKLECSASAGRLTASFLVPKSR
ncbi:hypothetical protein EV401DRAFT_1938285 [Pisolithus croceorrhizus]|nr:hypothetical protein EV401DRAFT_1938285 [Pisolithus croceorrhizus]